MGDKKIVVGWVFGDIEELIIFIKIYVVMVLIRIEIFEIFIIIIINVII